MSSEPWPYLKSYDTDHLRKIALPIGGIGTGTVSLGGRGDLRDWEIMNRPAKGYTPNPRGVGPLAAIRVKASGSEPVASLIEGPIDACDYEGESGCTLSNHGFPRFPGATFKSAYPLGEIDFETGSFPAEVALQAFNPMIPGNVDDSGYPVAVLRYQVSNPSDQAIDATVAVAIPNFVGNDGQQKAGGSCCSGGDCKPKIKQVNTYKKTGTASGVLMSADGMDTKAPQWGSIALTTPETDGVSHRTYWANMPWGYIKREFWEELLETGGIVDTDEGIAVAALAVQKTIPAGATASFTFVISWHFPNRPTWSPREDDGHSNIIGNYYTTRFSDAWDAATQFIPRLADLEAKTLSFLNAFCNSSIPEVVKESALFNASTLRTQTCFMTPDGLFYAWEGCHDGQGCCQGSCTHVWNYEHGTAFLFGDLSRKMRVVEFKYATNENGHMAFRVNLPLPRAEHKDNEACAAADGQMGCLMKLYRDWQLSGDDEFLKELWPKAKKSLEFCWVENGWDGDCDGVMEGCQHNTMDVEYFGPNPQMELWYLGALKSAALMAAHLGDTEFAEKCQSLFEKGKAWTEANLFNGDYYKHIIQPPKDGNVAFGLQSHMGAKKLDDPILQLGDGCLVDQLIGQLTAHVLGLGYLVDEGQVKTTLKSIMKYNFKEGFADHFNHMRSYVMGDESALLMATYPKGNRPKSPFPYFSEVMTGFEYTAGVHMLYEGMLDDGLKVFDAVRERYDGWRRSPFDEAECGHHYGRTMVTWAAVLALSGFQYSGVTKTMTFNAPDGTYFWSTGDAWGTCTVAGNQGELTTLYGDVAVETLVINGNSVACS